MRTETEVREKLDYYQAMLAGIEVGRSIDNPNVFLALSEHFPKEAVEMLQASVKIDELVSKLPVEDQQWIWLWFSSLVIFARQVLGNRITILNWVLQNEKGDGGVTGGGGI